MNKKQAVNTIAQTTKALAYSDAVGYLRNLFEVATGQKASRHSRKNMQRAIGETLCAVIESDDTQSIRAFGQRMRDVLSTERLRKAA